MGGNFSEERKGGYGLRPCQEQSDAAKRKNRVNRNVRDAGRKEVNKRTNNPGGKARWMSSLCIC